MRIEGNIVHRKIIPSSRENRGPTDYMPDAPPTGVTELRRLSKKYPASIDVPLSRKHLVETIRKDFGRGPARGQRIIPTTTNPLLDSQFVDVRGGRIIGGGTSREAIRNAKKKQKGKPERKPN